MDPQEPDVVGIVGAGRLGRAMARVALHAGRRVVLANSRGPDSLADVVAELGDRVTAGTVEQTSAAHIVVIAVPWPRVPEAVRGIQWNGRIVIDTTNDFDGTDLNGTTSSELVASLVPDARQVGGPFAGANLVRLPAAS
jgi:predicted dinucleotide-binding enzyme